MATRRVGILLFNEIEVLDFAGPFEVFSVASRVALRDRLTPEAPFEVVTLARDRSDVCARGGLLVKPHYAISDHPRLDILIVPGGVVDEPLADAAVIAWVAGQGRSAELTASVCTGAFITGKAGLLDGRTATTHWEDLADLRTALPKTTVIDDVMFVDEGRVVSSAGISAGIEMCLHLVERLQGSSLADLTARQMQYDRRPPDL